MRITIVTWGSDGDVRPYVSLALGLKQTGHEVQLATHISYQEFVNDYGVECLAMDWDIAGSLDGILNFRPLDTIILGAKQLDNGLLGELWRVCQQAEAIIFNPHSYPCYYIAEKLGIPCYGASVQPHHPTRAFPHPWVTNGKSLGSIYNWFSYQLFDQVFWQFIRRPINQWRQKTLNMPSLSILEGVIRRMQRQKLPLIYGYSPYFLPKPSEWADDSIHVTGYWFLDSSENWQPPTNLMNFLSAGSPPVYISKLWNQDKLSKEILLKLLALTGQRIIVQALDDDFCDLEVTDKLFCIQGSIPHEWLFPKMAAVVHHGGLGTIMTSLRAGVPMVTVPVHADTDHLFWALQIAQSGLGLSLISRKEQSSVESLAAAIKVAISDKSRKLRLAQISKEIQKEDGVRKAVEAFHQHLPFNQLLGASTCN
jgi:sterol 3beta-glucosyltransferase